jgi:hypothetical protein
MRTVLAACALLVALSCAQAQDQERNLIDRLLRPDMRLQNTVQNKTFIAADSKPVDKRATTGAFYVWKQSTYGRETFQGSTRDVSAWQFNARSFHGADKRSNVSSRRQIPNSKRSYSTRTARTPRQAQSAGGTVEASVFSGQRPFLGEGKSQKSLNRQNPPLTIEEVRELLNKNK